MRPSKNDSFDRYMQDIHGHEILDREAEAELARRWVEQRDPRAAQALVEHNLRFVVKVAMGYRRYRLPMADLVQEGNLGLLKAVEKFDPSRGNRLISYAVWWIKAYIQTFVLRSWSMVRIGTTQRQRRLFYRLPRALAEAAPVGEGSGARARRIATELDVAPEEVRSMTMRLSGPDVSLASPLGGEEGATTLEDRLASPVPDPESLAAEQQDDQLRRRLLREGMASLPRRERRILELRYLGEDGVTLREVGELMGLSRERVRQLESQALRKLRARARRRYQGTDKRVA